MTFGGYSEKVVCDEAFTLKVPKNLDPARSAPLLCAGITTYSPLRHWGATKGKKVRNRWIGRAWAHGREVCSCVWMPHGFVHDVGEQGRGRERKFGADEVVISKNSRRDGEAHGEFRS
jgi:uncharacterized zinc-type alcohol dehydrogenase-like protein